MAIKNIRRLLNILTEAATIFLLTSFCIIAGSLLYSYVTGAEMELPPVIQFVFSTGFGVSSAIVILSVIISVISSFYSLVKDRFLNS